MNDPTLTPLEVLEDFFLLHNIDLIEDNNIIDVHVKSFIINDMDFSQRKLIIYAPSRMLDNKEKRWVLMHEFYHDYVKNGYYKLNDSIVVKKTIEGRINNRLIKEMIPYDTLVHYLKKGYAVWELAEVFFVPEYAIKEALAFYEGRIIEEYGCYTCYNY